MMTRLVAMKKSPLRGESSRITGVYIGGTPSNLDGKERFPFHVFQP